MASSWPSIEAPAAAFAPSQVRWRRYPRQVTPSTCCSFQRDDGVPECGRRCEVENTVRSVDERGMKVWQEAVVVVVTPDLVSTVATTA